MYNIVMMKRVLLCFMLFSIPFIAQQAEADSLKGGIEQTDTREQFNKAFFTGEVDVLDKHDTIKMTVSQVLNGSYTEIGDEFFAEITEDVLGKKK